jgi:hypothetical protein
VRLPGKSPEPTHLVDFSDPLHAGLPLPALLVELLRRLVGSLIRGFARGQADGRPAPDGGAVFLATEGGSAGRGDAIQDTAQVGERTRPTDDNASPVVATLAGLHAHHQRQDREGDDPVPVS